MNTRQKISVRRSLIHEVSSLMKDYDNLKFLSDDYNKRKNERIAVINASVEKIRELADGIAELEFDESGKLVNYEMIGDE